MAMPLDRFIVTPSRRPAEVGSAGEFHVFQCLPRGCSIRISESRPNHSHSSGSAVPSLTRFEKYVCVSGLPLSVRLNILNCVEQSPQGATAYHQDVQDAAKLSIMEEINQQVSSMTQRPKWSHALVSFKKDKINTSPLLGMDKLSIVMQHELLSTQDGQKRISPVALELMATMILSARCQKKRQLLARVLLPMRRTRSVVRRELMRLVESRLSEQAGEDQKADVKRFRKAVRQRMWQKDSAANIRDKIGLLTNQTGREFSASNLTIDSSASKSVFVSATEWQRRKEAYAQAKTQCTHDYQHNQHVVEERGLTLRDVAPPRPLSPAAQELYESTEVGRDELLEPQQQAQEAVGADTRQELAGNIVTAAELSNDDTIRELSNEPAVAELSAERGLQQLFELMSSIFFANELPVTGSAVADHKDPFELD
jgi:hypothetical protein